MSKIRPTKKAAKKTGGGKATNAGLVLRYDAPANQLNGLLCLDLFRGQHAHEHA